ncbi:MAG: TIGR00730 family Rossman fold protein [Sphingobacteriaceae bacterium]|nr:TIGR00730 family Rossman fold protein [Cytophagaceae bacterium]
MKSLCVFCGSSTGHRELFRETAVELGKTLAERGIRLVYGGGNVGLMGVVANATLDGGGEVTGVIPQFLKEWEVAHLDVTELLVTQTMHDRKARMAELSDAFVALPGGFGTLDELFEILTWKQLRLHAKPVILLNVDGFFDPLIAMVDSMVTNGFVSVQNRQLVQVATTLDGIFDLLANQPVSAEEKWVDASKV